VDAGIAADVKCVIAEKSIPLVIDIRMQKSMCRLQPIIRSCIGSRLLLQLGKEFLRHMLQRKIGQFNKDM